MEQQQQSFADFVLSTCNPSHIRSARRGMSDWVQVGPNHFASQSMGYTHECLPHTCQSWVLRFVDGVKICAISGRMLLNPPQQQQQQEQQMDVSNVRRKRVSTGDGALKRHQDKPVPGSSAYLTEKFNLDGHDNAEMELDETSVIHAPFIGRKTDFY